MVESRTDGDRLRRAAAARHLARRRRARGARVLVDVDHGFCAHESDRRRGTDANANTHTNALAIADTQSDAEPHAYADPELKSARRYTNLSAAEVRAALTTRGYLGDRLPSERTMRDILDRMNCRPKRIRSPRQPKPPAGA